MAAKGNKLSPQQRAAMATLIMAGARTSEIAATLGVTDGYVSEVKRKLRQSEPAQFDYRTAKERLRQSAYPAVNDGLECTDDPYKRAQLGIQVLKGTGDLAPDHLSIVAQTWNTPPPALAQVLDACDRVRLGPGPAADAPVIDVELASESESKSGAGE